MDRRPAAPTYAPDETLYSAIAGWARDEPTRPFLHEIGGGSCTFADVHAAGLRWASAFRSVGIGAGDNVPVMGRTSIATVEHWLGLGWLRAVRTGVNAAFFGEALRYALDNSRAEFMICDREHLDRVAAVAGELDRLRLVIVPDAAGRLPARFPVALVDGAELWAGAAPGSGVDVPLRHEIAGISYTSGTSGVSKGVLIPWGRLWPDEIWPDMTGDDVYYSPFPVFHMAGLLAIAWAGFSGGQVVVRDSFSTSQFWADIRAYGCTKTSLIPTMLHWLLDQPPGPDDRDHPLRDVAGTIVPRVDEFKRRFGVHMRTVFGTTETGAPLYAGPDVDADPASSAMSPSPGFQTRVVDEHDNEVADGEIGELIVRCDQPWRMMVGYFGYPDKTAEAWRNGWFHTGDGFVRDRRGRYLFVDRIKDSIRRRGENISSADVEAHANAHPDVVESAAIAVPSEHGEDDVKVCVVLRPGATVSHRDLHDFLRERMPPFMVPRYLEFLEAPERTEAMKRIKKPALREDPLNATTWCADRDA